MQQYAVGMRIIIITTTIVGVSFAYKNLILAPIATMQYSKRQGKGKQVKVEIHNYDNIVCRGSFKFCQTKVY